MKKTTKALLITAAITTLCLIFIWWAAPIIKKEELSLQREAEAQREGARLAIIEHRRVLDLPPVIIHSVDCVSARTGVFCRVEVVDPSDKDTWQSTAYTVMIWQNKGFESWEGKVKAPLRQ
jgi:hypothetical protein